MSDLLIQKYVQKVAKDNHESVEKAAKRINECMLLTSAKLNIDLNVVYSTIYSEEFLIECVSDFCDKLTLEQCKKSCYCVEFEDRCVSKRIPNVKEINNDPDKYIKTLSMKELNNLVKLASYLYYNYEGGGLDDNSFDALDYHLRKRMKIKNRVYEKIGAEPIKRLRAKLPFPMSSLEKVKPGDKNLYSFLQHNKKICYSEKLDGTSGMIVYKDGKPDQMFTRGDGEIGGNVTPLLKYIKLPKISTDYVVRGEFIIPTRVWNEKYKDISANPRSFVNGKVNSGHVTPALYDIHFIAHEIVNGTYSPSQSFKILEAEGFQIPKYGVFESPSVFQIMTTYQKKREESEYIIDGLVLNSEESKDKVAFKMPLESQTRKSKVINVEWNISKHGRYVPVVIFESVYVDNVRLHRATAHNAAHIRDWSMGKGTEITVIRSGDVIPQIKDVIVNGDISPIYPDSKYEWEWDERDKDIVLKDIEGNPEVQIQRIAHFFETLNTRGFAEGRVRACWDGGMTTLSDFINANPSRFREIKGFAEKLSNNVYNSIHNSLREAPLDRYLVATQFNMKIGRKLTKMLLRDVPDIINMSTVEITKYLKINKIRGIGPKRIEEISKGMPKFREYLYSFDEEDIKQSINNHMKKLKQLKIKGYNEYIKGNSFVLTGFMKTHYELEDFIYDNFGNISSVVSSTTKAVICGNITHITNKMINASKLKIPVYSLFEFEKIANFSKT